jgi:hypothetical protein
VAVTIQLREDQATFDPSVRRWSSSDQDFADMLNALTPASFSPADGWPDQAAAAYVIEALKRSGLEATIVHVSPRPKLPDDAVH